MDEKDIEFPKDLNDCFRLLKLELDEKTIEWFKNLKKERDVLATHHGIGRAIRNRWLLGKSPFKKLFKDNGISDSDSMSTIIMVMFHRHLNGISDQNISDIKQIFNEFWNIIDQSEKIKAD